MHSSSILACPADAVGCSDTSVVGFDLGLVVVIALAVVVLVIGVLLVIRQR